MDNTGRALWQRHVTVGLGRRCNHGAPYRDELENAAVLGALAHIGYDGSIGALGWDYGGDIYLKLERCLRTVRGMEGRLHRHPGWAGLPRG